LDNFVVANEISIGLHVNDANDEYMPDENKSDDDEDVEKSALANLDLLGQTPATSDEENLEGSEKHVKEKPVNPVLRILNKEPVSKRYNLRNTSKRLSEDIIDLEASEEGNKKKKRFV